MAIFSKRSLHEILNQNVAFLSKEQLKNYVNRLNKGGHLSIESEWEVVILNAFSKIGHVKYEQAFGGTSLPDLFFTARDNQSISFLADITTVSDRGYEEDNPVRPFINETIRILKKNNIKLNGFHYEIGSTKKEKGVKLKIPPKSQFSTFFSSPKFKNFVSEIKENPASQQSLNFISENTEVGFFYNPQGEYFSGGHASYKTAHSLTKNPVYYSLREKAEQLKKSGYKGNFAIFLCDGCCDLLTSTLRDWQSFSLDAVLKEFFRQHSSVHFILIFAVKETQYNFLDVRRQKFIEVKLFSNPTFELSQGLVEILNRCVTYIPLPIDIALNATRKVGKGHEKQGNSFYGGSTMTSKTIKISSRGLLELLSGKIKQNKFLQDHQFAPTAERPDNRNFFELKLNEGRLINNVRLEKSADKDDDWIIFEFGEPDPAIFRFVVPKK